MLIVGRFINGLCVGICSSQVPVYVSELSPPHRRGLVVGTQQWAITWGVLIMFYISYGCSFLEGTKAFRIPWGVQMVPALIMCIGLFFLPESARWLARNDRWDDCHRILAAIHGHGDLDNPFVQMELQQLNEVCVLEQDQANVSYLDLFRPNVIWRTHIGMFVQIWSQLTGINVIMYCKYFPIVHRCPITPSSRVQGKAKHLPAPYVYPVNETRHEFFSVFFYLFSF